MMNASRFLLRLLFLCFFQAAIVSASVLGGETVAYTTEPFTQGVTHRQDVCHRYDKFRSGELELRYALEGLELRPIMRLNDFFNYDPETGIDEDDPGLMATLMDELADRAGFTWRDSFGILEKPTHLNFTWTFTDLLIWSVDTYDIAVNWWDQSVERMERGVAYIEPWFDGSVILIDQEDPAEESGKINFFNWLKPFERNVWLLTVLTVLVSGVVHQLIEYLNDERNERSLWQWYTDNAYLSWLNVTQNYEYAPNSTSGRIFGVSMGIWALIMMATYTANLASLLVEQKEPPLVVDSIDQAIVLDIPICTYGNTNADFIIKRRYENAIRIPKKSELEAYEALRRGECGLVAGYKDNWLGYQMDSRYNPNCDLAWVGRTVEIIKSGFATKADAGHLCSSLIRDVLNLHLTELIRDGVLEDAWGRHREKVTEKHAINCAADDTTDENTPRFLRQQDSPFPRQERKRTRSNGHRKLKGGSKGNSAATNSADEEGERLNVQQMAGVFLLHFVMMAIAVILSAVNRFLRIRQEKKAEAEKMDMRGEFAKKTRDTRVSFRAHGPIIGSAPPVNTFVQRDHMNIFEDMDATQQEDSDRTDNNEPHAALYSSNQNTVSNELGSAVLRKLHNSVRLTQQEMQDSHSELRSHQVELSRQMNVVMGMLQEMYNRQHSMDNGGEEKDDKKEH